jgi:hypothetical protein
MEIINKSIICYQCGAPVPQESMKCQYCGTEFGVIDAEAPQKKKKLLKDFGWRGMAPFSLNIIGILILYSIGWILEDKQYWLDDSAIVFWAVLLPLWILIMTFIWSQKKGAIIIGFILCLIIFGVHLLLIMMFERWHFNDDYLGIAVLFASIPLGSWIVGRVLHHLVRIKINKNKDPI